MAELPGTGRERDSRRSVIRVAGLATILLGIVAALLPLMKTLPGGAVVGWLLLLAGLAETLAAAVRRPGAARAAALAAGGLTSLAGLAFIFRPFVAFIPLSWVVTGWLLVRAAIQLAAASRCSGPIRAWTAFSGMADLLLGLILLVGLPVAVLVTGLFGATREIVASFALVFAVSFMVTGLFLLTVARSEGEDRAGAAPRPDPSRP